MAIVATVVAGLVTSCSTAPLPGNILGTYKVSATADSSTCGSGLNVPSPWTFDVEISEKGSTFYWSWLDGSALLSSPIEADASTTTTLTSTQQGDVDQAPDGAAGPCTMQRSDTIDITLGSGKPPGSFTGTMTYDFSVVSGASCSDQLTASGGSFAALPCTVKLSMTANRQ